MSEIKNPSVFEEPDISDEELNKLISGTLAMFDDGDLVTGTVVAVDKDEVLLDIGFKSEGVIPARELSIRKDVDPSTVVQVGDTVEALVLQKEDKEGRLLLSKKRAEYERSWLEVEEKFNKGINVEGEVIEIVRGGLILDIGLRGFLPASLVDLRRVRDLDSYLHTTLEARVIEMDRNRNNIVLSRRVVLEQSRKEERAQVMEKLTKGMRLKGKVSSIVEFGAFVDLGGIDGLVHISELSWNHVSHPSEVVKVGQEVEVEVLDVDMERERISLGLKQTQEDPWRTLVANYPAGAILEGTVTKLVPFGAFVSLGEGVEGLVHISEMANTRVEVPSQVCKPGDKVQVKVMEVDLDRRRISLSMRAAAEVLGIDIKVAPVEKPTETEQAEGEAAASEGGKEKAAAEKKAEPAPEPAEDLSNKSLDEMKKSELLYYAGTKGVSVSSKMTKAEIIEALEGAEEEPAQEAEPAAAKASEPAASDAAADYSKMKKDELLEAAKSAGVEVDSKMTKAQLIEALEGGASKKAAEPKKAAATTKPAADKATDYSKMKKDELIDAAKAAKVEVNSKMTKAQIIEALEANNS